MIIKYRFLYITKYLIILVLLNIFISGCHNSESILQVSENNISENNNSKQQEYIVPQDILNQQKQILENREKVKQISQLFEKNNQTAAGISLDEDIVLAVDNEVPNSIHYFNLDGKIIFDKVFNNDGLYTNPTWGYSHLMFSESIAGYYDEKNELYGYIDKNGEFIIEAKFLFINKFIDGLAAVVDPETNLWGYIDKTGQYIISPKFVFASDFSDGLAQVILQETLDTDNYININNEDLKRFPVSFINLDGEVVLNEVTYCGVTPMNTWPKFENGIIPIYNKDDIFPSTLINIDGEDIIINTDCPRELSDVEIMYVGNHIPEFEWLNNYTENSVITLKHDRTATIHGSNEIYYWVAAAPSRGTGFGYLVFLQDSLGNITYFLPG